MFVLIYLLTCGWMYFEYRRLLITTIRSILAANTPNVSKRITNACRTSPNVKLAKKLATPKRGCAQLLFCKGGATKTTVLWCIAPISATFFLMGRQMWCGKSRAWWKESYNPEKNYECRIINNTKLLFLLYIKLYQFEPAIYLTTVTRRRTELWLPI